MKLLFKQRILSWFDTYDIYDESSNPVYFIKGQFSWGHCLKVFDNSGNELGTVKERVFTFLPKFELYIGQTYLGCISREFTFFKPTYNIDCNGWHIEGDILGWNYTIVDSFGRVAAAVTKELFNWTDTYVIDIADPKDALCALMFVIAIDAEKCSANN